LINQRKKKKKKKKKMKRNVSNSEHRCLNIHDISGIARVARSNNNKHEQNQTSSNQTQVAKIGFIKDSMINKFPGFVKLNVIEKTKQEISCIYAGPINKLVITKNEN